MSSPRKELHHPSPAHVQQSRPHAPQGPQGGPARSGRQDGEPVARGPHQRPHGNCQDLRRDLERIRVHLPELGVQGLQLAVSRRAR